MSFREVSELLFTLTAKIRDRFSNTALATSLADASACLSWAHDRLTLAEKFARSELDLETCRFISEAIESLRNAVSYLSESVYYLKPLLTPYAEILDETRRKVEDAKIRLETIVRDCIESAREGKEKFSACVIRRLPEVYEILKSAVEYLERRAEELKRAAITV